MSLFLCALLVTLVMPPPPMTGTDAPSKRDKPLERRLAAIAKSAPGLCLISVRHLESGRTARVHTDHRAPMASVYKVPIALAVLHEIEVGRLAFDTPVTLLPGEMNPGGSRIAESHPEGGATLTAHELLNAMLVESDNTACDALLRVIGGPRTVQIRLDFQRAAGINVSRTEMEMGNDWFGLETQEPESTWTRAKLTEWRQALPPETRRRAARAYLRGLRDFAFPTALEDLLVRTWRRRVLTPVMTDTLFAMMTRATTGTARLRAGFPPQCVLAHKSGTGGTYEGRTSCVNDIGIVRLPGSGGTVAIVVMLRDARGEVAEAERVIARVAATVFDAWNAPE